MSQRDYFEKDYYGVLGVAKDATAADVAKAYRRLARENHPDAKPGDAAAEARFKEASEANSVLSNPERRAEYDRVRDLVGSGGGFRGFGGAAQGVNVDLGDLLGQVFGNDPRGGPGTGGGMGGFGTRVRRGPGPRARQGRDVETTLTLSFSDALAGVTTTLRVSGRAPCSTCGGSGAAPGTSPVTCTVCGGAGVVASNQGLFSFSEPCTTCGGTGRVIPEPCPTCHGSGSEVRPRDIRARIPAGVREGARIRLAGKGETGDPGAPPGDLFVTVRVEPHPIFERRDDHITLRAPITFAEATLGAKITVPTLGGDPVTLKVPGGTESGRTFRVRGRGVHRSGATGDLLVTVDVVVPRTTTRAQRKALQAYADVEDGDVRAALTPYLEPEPAEA